jgi:hypothetical protein
MTRTRALLAVAAALVVGVALGFAIGHSAAPPGNDCERFDAGRWARAQQEREFVARHDAAGPLADALEGCPALVHGRTRASVRDLLGAPTETAQGDRVWNYSVGVPEGQSDWGSLQVFFGPDGRVTRVLSPE